MDPSLIKNRAVLAIMGAQSFYGTNMLGMMYHGPQFFQLGFKFSATLSAIGLLPVILGLYIGNSVAAFITSKFGISLWNAIAGAALDILIRRGGRRQHRGPRPSSSLSFSVLVKVLPCLDSC